jgi:hypothetical protein
VEENFGSLESHGIWIDIFPLDNVGDNFFKNAITRFSEKIAMKLVGILSLDPSSKKTLKHCFK